MSELLSPAGSMEALVAAVQNGADAVYFGARLFNARRGAENFDGDGLAQAVSYCHARGVKAHVTLNTLVRQDELPALEAQIAQIAQANADAVIVQDLGVAASVRRIAPGLSLHASTQMAVHNRQGVEFLARHGFSRAVLAREMSLREIENCACPDVELEAFCHGALCVSCSGQCLFSSLVGGRSGNRGMCAQPCRLPYRLGEKRGYLLSPRDLMLVDALADMRRAGVASFKIEGRLKRPEYVAVVTGIYRRALDGDRVTDADREALLQIFNRGGFSRGYLRDMNDAALMCPDRPDHAGVLVAQGGVLLRDVRAADALVQRGPGGQDRALRLNGRAGGRVAQAGSIFRLADAQQLARARESYAQENRTVACSARLVLRVGERARLRVSDGENAFEAVGDAVEPAVARPLDAQRARSQIARTGGTPYRFGQIELEADERAFVTAAQLNALRRDALDGLTRLRTAPKPAPAPVEAPTEPEARPEAGRVRLIARAAEADVLLRALEAGADEAALEMCDLRRGALDAFARAMGERAFALALPAVADADVLGGVRAWAWDNRRRLTAVYASNVAHLALDWPVEVRGDFALNLTNARAVREAALARYMPSLELTARQAAQLPGEKELLIWGRAPLMRLRHCPLRAAWALPGAHAACRRCDRSERCDRPALRDRPADRGAPARLEGLALVDRMGAAFPLRRVASDAGCVVEVLNSVPHWLLPRRDRLCAASGWVLLLRADEPVEAVVRACRAALDGAQIDLSALEGAQTTSGHCFRGVE